MDLKAIFKQVIRPNIGYIVYLFIVNSYVLNSYYQMVAYSLEKVSGFGFDGADFSFFANILVSLINIGLNLLIAAITFILVLISSVIFNGFYIKSVSDVEFVRRIKDIRNITLVVSCLSISWIIIYFSDLTKALGLIYYIPFPLLVYLLVKNKIIKIYRKQNF